MTRTPIKKHIALALTLALCAGGAFAQFPGDVGADSRLPVDGGMDARIAPFRIDADGHAIARDDTMAGEADAQVPVGDDADADDDEGTVVVVREAEQAEPRFSVGGGVDMVLVPLQIVTRDTAEHRGNVWVGAGVGRNAFESGIRTRINLSGNHENRFGFVTDVWLLYSNDGANLWGGVHHNAMEVRLGDNGNIWWKPRDWLRIDVGRVFNHSQSGYVHGHWLSLWSVGMFDGDNIFSSHYSGDIGALARFTPPRIDGLSIYVFVPHFGMPFTRADAEFGWLPNGLLTPGGDALNGDDEELNRLRAFRVFQRTWLTLGYRISDRAHARVQFVGANPFGAINWTTGSGDARVDVDPYRYRVGISAPRFEAAFAYTAGNLVVDLGARTWIPVSNWITDVWSQDVDNPGYLRGGHPGTFWGGLGFGLGASVLLTEDLRLSFRADGDMLRGWTGTRLGADARITNPTRLSFHLWSTYRLANGMSLLAAVGANHVGRNAVDIGGTNPNAGVAEWERSTRLRMGGGLSLTIPVFGPSSVTVGLAYGHGTADTRGGEPRAITIPISFAYHW